MKKNLITVVIFSMCFVNLVLSALIVFVLVPSSSKTNNLITKISQAVDLELEANSKALQKVGIEDLAFFDLNKDAPLLVRLKNTDKKEHYASVEITISVNSKSKKAAEYSKQMEAMSSVLLDNARTIMQDYTVDQAKQGQEEIQKKILSAYQQIFGSDYVVAVNFGKYIIQ